jgi:ferritin-like protein
MGTAGNNLVRNVEINDVVRSLDRFYCYNLAVTHWAGALGNRLQGPAAFLLGSELEDVAEHGRTAAKALADRIGDLGGAVTADPGQLVQRSALAEFSLPASFSDVGTILRYAVEQVQAIIRDYATFLDQVRGNDELSYQLVLRLLGDEVHREAEIEAALEDGGGPAGLGERGPGD